MEVLFRFQRLRIWREAVDLAKDMLDLAKRLSDAKLYGYANQLERASLSIPNNIAEGTGSASNKEFANFLNISRRSLYECVNIIIIIYERQVISNEEFKKLINDLVSLSRQISALRNHLLKNKS